MSLIDADLDNLKLPETTSVDDLIATLLNRFDETALQDASDDDSYWG